MNPSRVTNADVDSDYAGKDRETVKQFLLRDHMGISTVQSAEIITFNTIALKGAVRDVCRALYKDSTTVNYMKLSDEISRELDDDESSIRKKYPEIFEYVDIINGTIVSVGTHPSGVLISDLPIEKTVGLCSISSTPYPVSMINMKELDDLMYVKLDILGLDNLAVINETCKSLGIPRLTPDNTDLDDPDVWRSIRDDTTLIFQWESRSAQAYLRKFMSDRTLEIARQRIPNFSMLKWMSFGNGLLRPACASFRDSVANGEFYDNGFDALNDFLAPEAGRIAMQETIMQFLVKFCGYSAAESDTVRRGIAKKKGTEKLLPEIKRRFIAYTSKNYGLPKDRCEEVIEPFLQVILDASAYAFSWNHSDAYSAIGYISGYLRYYHPLNFLTAALNVFGDDLDKTAEITEYAHKVGIQVTPPKWGFSRGEYFFDEEKNVIAKGLASVKYMGSAVADELYALAHSKRFDRFTDVLKAVNHDTSINQRQLEILIKLDFFEEFGNQRELLRIKDMFYETFKCGDLKQIKKDKVEGTLIEPIVQKYSLGFTKGGAQSKSYKILDIDSIMSESEDALKSLHIEDLSVFLKARNYEDIMGFAGYVSGKEEDRPKLLVCEKYPAKRRKDGFQFGWNIVTKSIGSGKSARFTVFLPTYEKDPINKKDIILCQQYTKDNGYFTLRKYEHIY